MHIPENYLSPSTCGVLAAVMVPVWHHAIRAVKEEVPRERMPMLGVAAAFSFLAMMFNVPVVGGTTGHAVCGTLIAILFGPWPAVLALSIALALQAVLFGDGGILALGANCFNMAFVLPMTGYAIYRLVRGGQAAPGSRRELVAAAIGSYVGINAAAFCAAVEFGIQPLLFTDAAGQALYCPYPLSVSIPAMMLAHLTICGAAEVIFTVGILAFVRRTAGDAEPAGRDGAMGRAGAARGSRAIGTLLVILIALVPLGLLAEGDAWGEWSPEDVAQAVGYEPSGLAHGWQWEAFLPDYSWGGLPDWAGYLMSAVIGVLALVIIFRLIAASGHAGAAYDGSAS